jgi:hypothetical protein
MGKGSAMPRRARVAHRGAGTPRSANEGNMRLRSNGKQADSKRSLEWAPSASVPTAAGGDAGK